MPVFFPDTFTNCYEPKIGLAAGRLLDASSDVSDPGARLAQCWLDGLRCCGRPLISNGFLDRAVENARHNVRLLFEPARQGRKIIACEPSCILTIKDDYPALLRGEEKKRAAVVAAACRTVEELLDESLAKGSLALQFRPGPRRIFVQPHCHQRSLIGTGALLSVLRRIPGAEVIDLDAGCCGMAGSFGYEKEHYEISRLVGEQRLFPAIRSTAPDDVIIAPGFSCRLQIEHFTRRRAVHPIELLASLLHAPGTAERGDR